MARLKICKMCKKSYYIKYILLCTFFVTYVNTSYSNTNENIIKSEWTIVNCFSGDYYPVEPLEFTIKEIESVGTTSSINIISLLDGNKGTHVYLSSHNGPCAFDKIKLNEINCYNNFNIGSSENLIKFIKFVIDKYPSKKLMLTISCTWGWANGPDFQRLLTRDDTGEQLYTENLKYILKSIYEYRKSKIDILCVDVKYKQRIDILYEIRNYCNVYISGNELSCYDWPYKNISSILVSNPKIDNYNFAYEIINSFKLINLGSHNVVAFRLDYMDDLVHELNKLSRLLILSLDYIYNNLEYSRNNFEILDRFCDFEEIINFINKLNELKKCREYINIILKIYNKSIINKYSNFNGKYNVTCGILSPFSYYSNLDSKMEFSKSIWCKFVKIYYNKKIRHTTIR